MVRHRDGGHSGPIDAVAFVDARTGAARPMRALMRYVFPDHWSFMLGEVALYSFVALILTGTFLALNFNASDTTTIWHGPYAPLDGLAVSGAYASSLDLSFKVPGGLLLRQTHHWAALLFFVAILLHMCRILLTGAFRKPRTLNYLIGVTMLMVALFFEGLFGYSMLDDLISGSGLAITYGVIMSLPLLGGFLASVFWDGSFPGGHVFSTRLFFTHVFILPALLTLLITAHLTLIMRMKHTQLTGPGRREHNVVGTPMWPGYAMRALGLFAAVAALLVLLGGLIQINPVWLWGPYKPWLAESGAQPDFYLGWLIGALRAMPGFDVTVGGSTLIPNPFWGGILFPGIVFGGLLLIPLIDRLRWTRDEREHHLLQLPREAPQRSAFVAAGLTLVAVVFLFGASDRLFLAAGIGYEPQLWIARALVFAGPAIAYCVTLRVCRERAARDAVALAERASAPPQPRSTVGPGAARDG